MGKLQMSCVFVSDNGSVILYVLNYECFGFDQSVDLIASAILISCGLLIIIFT